MGRRKILSDEDLLAAARKIFLAEGLSASTRAIAREAGVSEAVIFQRYRTKAELFFAAMSPPAFDLAVAAPAAAPGTPPVEIVRSLFLAMLDYFRAASPVFIHLLSSHDFHFEQFAQSNPNNSFVTLRSDVVARLHKLKTEGGLGPDPRWAALALFATAQGLAIFERLGAHGGSFSPMMIEGTIAALWAGARPDV